MNRYIHLAGVITPYRALSELHLSAAMPNHRASSVAHIKDIPDGCGACCFEVGTGMAFSPVVIRPLQQLRREDMISMNSDSFPDSFLVFLGFFSDSF